MPRGDSASEIGRGHLDSAAGPVSHRSGLLPERGPALGLGTSAAPAFTFILAGVALGPSGMGLLSPGALLSLDPVVSVALAALGVFVGLGLGAAMRAPEAPRLLLAAGVETAITIAVVSGVMYVFVTRWAVPLPAEAGLFVAVLGICSCASAATRLRDDAPATRHAPRIVDIDDVPLVVLGTLAVAAAANAPLAASTLLTAAAGMAVGVAGWLLFERARNDAERGVFVAGAILLLGGIGAHLGTSPLLSGCAAALVWVRTPGRADRIIGSDLHRLQHPLVALLLIVAGASIQWNLALVWIAAPLVMLRLIGKLLAGTAGARIIGVPAGLLAAVLVPPGVIGIALALNVQQVLGSPGTLLLSGITVAAGLSELIALLLPGESEDSL